MQEVLLAVSVIRSARTVGDSDGRANACGV